MRVAGLLERFGLELPGTWVKWRCLGSRTFGEEKIARAEDLTSRPPSLNGKGVPWTNVGWNRREVVMLADGGCVAGQEGDAVPVGVAFAAMALEAVTAE